MRTTGAGVSFARMPATVSAYFRPGASLSGRIQTSLPARGRQSVLPAALEPPADVVATKPSDRAASAAFSPSQTTTRRAAARSGKPYSGRGSGIAPMRQPSPCRATGRMSFPSGLSQRTTTPTGSPWASW